MSIFDEIYQGNRWGFGSGHGSLPLVTKGYRAFIENFIRDNHINSIVDYGCGDWQFSRFINWGPSQYTGLDVVPSVVGENTRKYGSETVTFRTIEPDTFNPPKADLLIVKDVLQHLSSDDIKQFVQRVIPRYKYCLITNCILPTQDINKQIHTGEFRPLDLRMRPFQLNGTVVYSFTGPKSFSRSERKLFPAWKKQVLLVTN